MSVFSSTVPAVAMLRGQKRPWEWRAQASETHSPPTLGGGGLAADPEGQRLEGLLVGQLEASFLPTPARGLQLPEPAWDKKTGHVRLV